MRVGRPSRARHTRRTHGITRSNERNHVGRSVGRSGPTRGDDGDCHARSPGDRRCGFPRRTRPWPEDPLTDKVALAEATDLAKHWADNAGLQPFSFGLWSNELVVVRGRSGSGKSTLLALLAGWTAPDGGTLLRLGPWAEPGVDRTWKGTAMLPQVIAPIMELTMTENVALPLRLAGCTRDGADAHAREVLDQLDLTGEADRPASDASLGQQQRMGLARIAVVDPLVLLADEPRSHQDAGHIATVLQLARSMVDRGTCIVVATHDPAVADVADRVLDLDR